MKTEKMAYNGTVYVWQPLVRQFKNLTVARATVCLGHSATLHSHFLIVTQAASKLPPHFADHGLCCANPLFGPPKYRKQSERYMQ
jgi:hypothetical protein